MGIFSLRVAVPTPPPRKTGREAPLPFFLRGKGTAKHVLDSFSNLHNFYSLAEYSRRKFPTTNLLTISILARVYYFNFENYNIGSEDIARVQNLNYINSEVNGAFVISIQWWRKPRVAKSKFKPIVSAERNVKAKLENKNVTIVSAWH